MPSRVSIHEIRTYDPAAVAVALRALLEPLGGIGAFLRAGQTVLLKPNILQGAAPEKMVTTHPAILRAVIELCQATGARVLVGENPGVGDPTKIARSAKLLPVIEESGAEWVDLTITRQFDAPENTIGRRLSLPSILDEIDLLITLPKPKTHAQLTYTGAIKNQFGLIPGIAKARYHYRLETREYLAALLVDINRIAKPGLAIMDGIIGMEGLGPSAGSPREIGVLIAGADLNAVDVVACKLVGIDPARVPTIQAAAEVGYGASSLGEIEVVGADLAKLRLTDFMRVPELVSPLRILPLPPAAQRWIRRQWQPRPRIDVSRCTRCGICATGCPVEPSAIDPQTETDRQVNDATCIRCYCCHEFCPEQAIDLKPGRFAWLFRPLERL